MNDNEILSPRYSESRALIIGINDYRYASPLRYAISDAEAIAELLKKNFGFPEENVALLTDENATKQNIIDSFIAYIGEDVAVDDKIVFFFAGHGYTFTGRRGEVGYLVPHDGNLNNLSTLLRWDDLTRNAELIKAKHMLFIMDACYGGLAITRSLPPGSMRFLKDMLLRYSRQVLTAGKANEAVSDSGGPISGHSIFTGHLIEALSGKAASEDGVITANGVMAYVYEKVAKDQNSHQTPHYGFIDGDGDLVFRAPILEAIQTEGEKDEDVLVSVPSAIATMNISESASVIEITKEYLSDPKFTIKLHDLVTQELREIILSTSEDNFATQGIPWSLEEFTRRLHQYEHILETLQSVLCCIAYWGEEQHRPIVKKCLTRLTDRLEPESGMVVWQALRWYPVILLLYIAGVSALAADNYDNLATMLLARVGSSRSSRTSMSLTLATGEAILDLNRTDAFKQLPGHERYFVPRSEYMFKLLQPPLDDLLFLGRDYEQAFDRFEVLFALVHADLEYVDRSHVWGPVGRFGWKYRKEGGDNPLKDVVSEAEQQKESWGPLRAGFFGGDYSRFAQIATEYSSEISRLNWW
jgi:uncharacterized caspase-like protein